MYDFPSDEIVNKLKEDYPKGTRVTLVNIDDPYSKLQRGDRGTVKSVDKAGTLHIAWDCGSELSIKYAKAHIENSLTVNLLRNKQILKFRRK